MRATKKNALCAMRIKKKCCDNVTVVHPLRHRPTAHANRSNPCAQRLKNKLTFKTIRLNLVFKLVDTTASPCGGERVSSPAWVSHDAISVQTRENPTASVSVSMVVSVSVLVRMG